MPFESKADLDEWIADLQCPDCKSEIALGGAPESSKCLGCGRLFQKSNGIWNLLPHEIRGRALKLAEKDGWGKRSALQGSKKVSDEYLLSLPHAPSGSGEDYFRNAARDFDLALQIAHPLMGKKTLEIGASACWATRRFAEAGAACAALDFDDAPMRQAQVYLDRLPLSFLRMTGDAEKLPFRDDVFDLVFGCAVLHHLTDLRRAAHQIARVLRRGGMFIGIQEAFHPPYSTAARALRQSESAQAHLELGINEQSFRTSQYRCVFHSAGMQFELWNPRWDLLRCGKTMIARRGAGLYGNRDYEPEILANRSGRTSAAGALARAILKTHLWKIAAHPLIFPLLRDSILNYTRKPRIIVARKQFR